MGARRKDELNPKVRIPRAVTPHPCRICAHPVAADSAETALHPDCLVKAPRCFTCGHGTAIPDPHCAACAGTGTIATSACPWCLPAPLRQLRHGHRHRRRPTPPRPSRTHQTLPGV
jgi:hypothetical protein